MMGGILIDDSYDSVRSAKENRVPAKANPPTRLPLLCAGATRGFSLTVEQLVRLERMGEKSAKKLVNAIAARKERELWRLINGLSTPHVGERAAQKLAEYFRDLSALASAGLEELRRVPEVGPVMAQSIHDFFRNPRNQVVINKLRKAGVKMRA